MAASGEPRNELTFLLTEHGRPFKSAAAFGNKFADWCEQAGLTPVLVRPNSTFIRVPACEAGCAEQTKRLLTGGLNYRPNYADIVLATVKGKPTVADGHP